MSNDSFKPWYREVAEIHSAKEREEFIKGMWGFHDKEKSSHNGLSSFLAGTSILYGLGALFFGARAKRIQEEEINQTNENFLGEEFNYLTDEFKNIDFTKEIHRLTDPLMKSIDSTKSAILELERKLSTQEFLEISDIVPRQYKVALKKQISLYFDYASSVEFLIENIKANEWRAQDVESLTTELSSLGEKYEGISSYAEKTEEIINSWLDKNEDTPEGKRVKRLMNKIDL